MKKLFLLFGLFYLLFYADIFACEQIVTWENNDCEFFDGNDCFSRRTTNEPATEHIGQGSTSTPVTVYASPALTQSDGWNGTIYIYSYGRADLAATDFSNQDIFYTGELGRCSWVSLTNEELIQGRCSFGSEDDELYQALGYVLYRNNIIKISFGPPVGENTDPQTAYTRLQIPLNHAKALIDSKCGDIASNTAPQISILPDPQAETFAFQKNIVDGTGFTIFIEDADGIDDIELNTLKISIAGIDKTAHFLATARAMADRIEVQTTDTTMAIFIRPDPTLFMSDHNIFNIQWNGEWPVSLEICDNSAECHTAAYSIYFGPFLTVDEVVDPNCVQTTSESFYRNLTLNGFVIGNCGFMSAAADIYLGIQNSGGILWTYYTNVFGDVRLSRELVTFSSLLVPAGLFLRGPQLDLPVKWFWSPGDDDTDEFLLPGTYQILSTIIDLEINPAFANAMRIYRREVTLCE